VKKYEAELMQLESQVETERKEFDAKLKELKAGLDFLKTNIVF
jgi:hypothetical protein